MTTNSSFNYDGYKFKNVSLSEKNFNRQEGFKNSGTRSILVPELNKEYKFINGFPIKQDSRIYLPDKSTRTINQDNVFLTSESKLYRADELELDLPKNNILASISLYNYNGKLDGHVGLSRIIKPTPINLNRVDTGDSAQKLVGEWFKSRWLGITYQINIPGSNSPDIIIKHNNIEYNVEVKNSATGLKSLHCIFDKSVSRNKAINNYIEILSKKFIVCNSIDLDLKYDSYFLSLLEYYRNLDMSIGLPGDEGTKKSGKLPKELMTENIEILKTLKEIILEHFKEKKDDFFAIYNRKYNTVDIFNINESKENIFGFMQLGDLVLGGICSYGGVSSGAMRIGFKCKFNQEKYE